MGKSRGREPGNRMANVTILVGRQMVCILDKQWLWIGKDSAGMASLATVANVIVNIGKKGRCR